MLLTTRLETRQRGLQLLQHGFDNDIGFQPLATLALAKAYEAAGDKANAADAYSRFLKEWDKADDAAKPRVDEVKVALQRLTGENR